MFSIKSLMDCWRYGQLNPLFRLLLNLGFFFIIVLPLFWSYQDINFDVSNLVLIDILFGLPLMMALIVVAMIIWMGLIKTVACLMNAVDMDNKDVIE